MLLVDILAAGSSVFDVETATNAYLNTLQGPARAQSDAYFEGGYWLILWGAVVAIVIDWLFLRFCLTSTFRNWAQARFKRPFMIAWLTALLYTILGWIMTLPWTIYTDFMREKQYDLLDQAFFAWFSEQLTSLGILLVIAPLAIAGIYKLIRHAPRSWWLWGAAMVGTFLALGILIAPVFIAPLFNDYTEMENGPLRDRIVAMADKYDVPAEHIYVFDQSKQNKRISANVSGIGPTIRISLNDNLLERTSDDEVVAVMGHELGHYVLNHMWWMVGIMLALFALGLFLISRIAPWMIARYGARWGVSDIADPASIPVLSILLTAFFLLATPAINTLVRVNESKADAFGLDAAREPDGFAQVAMRLSEYRKIEPGAVEEALFFDHPSGRTRVHMAMEWKARNTANPHIVTPPAGYLDGPKDTAAKDTVAENTPVE